MLKRPPFNVAMIIPTGVGARQGGYAGDAAVWMQLLASICDTLITHPNVANAAVLQNMTENIAYVEGAALDAFLQGRWALRPVRHQRVGVLMDCGIEPRVKAFHRKVISAMQVVHGLDVAGICETSTPLDLQMTTLESGASGGHWANPESALEAAQRLVNEAGATAIALLSRFEDVEAPAYTQGETGGVDPIGGLEAILSHTLVEALQLPCANAPCFDWLASLAELENLHCSPLVAAESIAPTFLPCVLRGLQFAPAYVAAEQARPTDLSISDCAALVLPIDAMGGVPFRAAVARGIPVVAVASNTTVLNQRAESVLGVEAVSRLKSRQLYVEVSNYDEALGVLQRLKLGLLPPESQLLHAL